MKKHDYEVTSDDGKMQTVSVEIRSPTAARFVGVIIPSTDDASKMRRHLTLRCAEVIAKELDPETVILCGPILLTKDQDFAKGARA